MSREFRSHLKMRSAIMHKNFFLTKPKGRDQWKDLNVNGSMTLKLILEEWSVTVMIGFIWLKVGTSGSLCECNNE
jgi:hypothetical protein